MPGKVLQGTFSGGRPWVGGVLQARGNLPAKGDATLLPDHVMAGHGSGQALPPPVREKMESLFGADFSGIRVHVGQAAPSIGAIAFTTGNDIHFAPGRYNPHTPHGQQLLGHELTHVIQQRTGRVANPFGSGTALVANPALEAEADRMGLKAMAAQMKPAAASPPAPAHATGAPKAQAKGGAAPQTGYKLVVGAYMHNQPGRALPPQLAGHAFVSIQGPTGQAKTFGFSPENYSRMDPLKDLGKLNGGVRGRVHDDGAAFAKPGVKTRAFDITPQQAQAAMAKVTEYRHGNTRFSLSTRQCNTFATDVARAAGVRDPALGGMPRPADFYRKL